MSRLLVPPAAARSVVPVFAKHCASVVQESFLRRDNVYRKKGTE